MNICLTLTGLYQFMIVRAINSLQHILHSRFIINATVVILIHRICLKDVTKSSLGDLIPNRNLNAGVVEFDCSSLAGEQREENSIICISISIRRMMITTTMDQCVDVIPACAHVMQYRMQERGDSRHDDDMELSPPLLSSDPTPSTVAVAVDSNSTATATEKRQQVGRGGR